MAMKSITKNTTIQQFPSSHLLLHHHLRTTLQTPQFSVNNSPEKVTQRNSKRNPQISPLSPLFRFTNSTTIVCRRCARCQDSHRSLRDTRWPPQLAGVPPSPRVLSLLRCTLLFDPSSTSPLTYTARRVPHRQNSAAVTAVLPPCLSRSHCRASPELEAPCPSLLIVVIEFVAHT